MGSSWWDVCVRVCVPITASSPAAAVWGGGGVMVFWALVPQVLAAGLAGPCAELMLLIFTCSPPSCPPPTRRRSLKAPPRFHHHPAERPLTAHSSRVWRSSQDPQKLLLLLSCCSWSQTCRDDQVEPDLVLMMPVFTEVLSPPQVWTDQ